MEKGYSKANNMKKYSLALEVFMPLITGSRKEMPEEASRFISPVILHFPSHLLPVSDPDESLFSSCKMKTTSTTMNIK